MKTPTKPAATRRDLEARIIAKAWRDAAYRERLIKDPKAVLQEEIQQIDPNVKLPDQLTVSVHEESPVAYHLVVPRNPRDISLGEVVGEELEAVAPQTIAIVVLAAVAVNTVGVVNNVGVGNAVVTGNVAVNANAAATVTSVG